MKKGFYINPQVEVIRVCFEKGFAGSQDVKTQGTEQMNETYLENGWE